jgi:antitoxin MazE
MEAVIKKWGNSLGIRIPGLMAKDLELKDGSTVEIIDEQDQIVIRPKKGKTLKEMLKGINNSNIHNEIDTNGPIGKEVW